MKTYTIIVEGQRKRNLSQGQALRMHIVFKQQNIEHMILEEK